MANMKYPSGEELLRKVKKHNKAAEKAIESHEAKERSMMQDHNHMGNAQCGPKQNPSKLKEEY